jgi:putative aldouronate transport system substrate-binding protein
MLSRHSKLLALLLIFAFVLAGSAAQAQDLEPVELTYYVIGWPVTELDAVEAKVNEIIQPKINAIINFNIIDWGSYTDRMRLIANSGEQCDLMVISPDWNPYGPLVASDALTALDELLPEYAPNLWASMPEEMWDAARVNGSIYAVINQGNQARAYGAWVRKDLMEQYGFDWTQADSYEDLEPFFEQVVTDNPDIHIMSAAGTIHGRLWFPEAWGFDPLGGPARSIGIRYDDPNRQVLNVTETDEYRQVLDMTRRWYEKGFWAADPPPLGDIHALRTEGYVMSMLWNKIPGVDNQVAVGEYGGREIVQLVLSQPVMTTQSVASSMTGVCATSQNPERAVMFLELLNTDAYLLSTFVRGVEGQHWVWDDEAQELVRYPDNRSAEEVIAAYRAPDWAFGNKFLLYYAHPSEIGAREEMQELNNSAVRSTAMGFAADYSPVRTEYAQVEAAHQQYCDPLERGLIAPDEGLAECQTRLKEAGIDVLIAEVQRQMDEWAASLGN